MVLVMVDCSSDYGGGDKGLCEKRLWWWGVVMMVGW